MLRGKRVLVTRPRGEDGELIRLLERMNAEVFSLPGLEVRPPASWAALDAALGELDRFQWVTFTSRHAVIAFYERLAKIPFPRTLEVAAVGQKTANLLASLGATVSLVPREHTADALAEALASCVPGKRVLWPRGEQAQEYFARRLRAGGAVEVREVVCYTSLTPSADAREVSAALARGKIDAVAFASPKTVEGVLELLGPEGVKLLLRCRLAVIGPSTAKAVIEAGLPEPTIAEPHTIEGLVAAVVRALK